MADLAAAGARICVGYDAANLGDAQSVVAGSAIRPDNPELAAARAAGLPVLHRSEALAAAMAQDTAVTVAGTHGKSTTTSMITVLLQGAGPGPVLRHRRERPGAGRQRRQRQLAGLRRGSRRIRRVLPELPPADRRRDQRRTGPPRLLRHRRGRLRLLRPLHRPAPGRRRAGCLRGRRRRQGPGPADPASGATPAWCSTAPAMTPSLCCTTAARGTSRSPRPPARFPLELHVPGRHNALNAAAAFAVALELGVDPGGCRRRPGALHRGVPALRIQGRGPRRPGLRRLRPPPHRSAGGPVRGPVGGRRPQAARPLPAAPVLPDPGIRRRVRRGAQHRRHRPGPGHLSRPRRSDSRRQQPADRRAPWRRRPARRSRATEQCSPWCPPPRRGTSCSPSAPATSRPTGR